MRIQKTESCTDNMYWTGKKKERKTIGIQEGRGVENYLHVIYKRASLQECNTKV